MDPEQRRMKQAVLVIDVLAGIFELGEPLHETEAFVGNVRALISEARRLGVPVVYVRHVGLDGTRFARGSPGAQILAALAPLPGEVVVEKTHPDSFQESGLEAALLRVGARELVVCGLATEGCVDTTVRSAYARGYSVILVSDAHSTTRNEVLEAARIVAHHNAVLRRFARLLRHDEALAPSAASSEASNGTPAP
jgi:nicotinamidase-related amidase